MRERRELLLKVSWEILKAIKEILTVNKEIRTINTGILRANMEILSVSMEILKENNPSIKINLNALRRNTSNPKCSSLGNAEVIRVRAQRARCRKAVESYERERTVVDLPIRPDEFPRHEPHVGIEL